MMNTAAPLPPLPPPSHATLDENNTPDRNPWIRSFCKTAVKRLQLLTSQSAVTTRGVSPSTTTTTCSTTSSSCTTHNSKDQYRATAKDIRATYSAYELSSAGEATSDFHMPISSSTTTSGLSDALRRLTSTTSISRGLAALSSEKSCGKHVWLSKFNKKQISVFLKTPHVVAGSVMSGTIAIDMALCNTFDVLNPHTLPFKSLVLELHGIERMLYYYTL